MKLSLRYYAGEQECPFKDGTETGKLQAQFWFLEKNISNLAPERVRRIFGETNPMNWPPFIEKAKATYEELAIAFAMWYDCSVHTWGGDEGGLEWLEYFNRPPLEASRMPQNDEQAAEDGDDPESEETP